MVPHLGSYAHVKTLLDYVVEDHRRQDTVKNWGVLYDIGYL